MEVASRTLREVEFRQQLRGYHQDDVDEFLERVAAGIEVLQDRLREANERAVRAEQALSEQRANGRPAERPPEIDDDTVRRTLVLAQRTADLAVKEAKEEAARLVAEAEARSRSLGTEAEARARSLTTEAEERARTITAEAEAEAHRRAEEAGRQLEEDVARLTATRAELVGQVTSLEEHLEVQRRRVQGMFEEALEWVRKSGEASSARPEEATRAMEAVGQPAGPGGRQGDRGGSGPGGPGPDSSSGGSGASGSGSSSGADTARSSGGREGQGRSGLSAREELGRMLQAQNQARAGGGGSPARPPQGAPGPRTSTVGSAQGSLRGEPGRESTRPDPGRSESGRPDAGRGGQGAGTPGRGGAGDDPAQTRLMPMAANGVAKPVYDVEESEEAAGRAGSGHAGPGRHVQHR